MENSAYSPTAQNGNDSTSLLNPLDLVPIMIYTSDNATKTIRWCNRYMEQTTGYSLAEMNKLGIAFFQAIIHPEDFPNNLKLREAFQSGGKEFSGTCRIKGRGDTQWKWWYGVAVPFSYDEEGNVKEVLCNFLELKGMDTPVQMHQAFNWILKKELESRLAGLTCREREIITALAKHKKDKLVAQDLYIEVSTLKTHKDHIREKLGTENFNLLLALQQLDEGEAALNAE